MEDVRNFLTNCAVSVAVAVLEHGLVGLLWWRCLTPGQEVQERQGQHCQHCRAGAAQSSKRGAIKQARRAQTACRAITGRFDSLTRC